MHILVGNNGGFFGQNEAFFFVGEKKNWYSIAVPLLLSHNFSQIIFELYILLISFQCGLTILNRPLYTTCTLYLFM